MSELAKYIFFYFLRRKSASCTRFSSAACLTGYPSNHINLCSLGQDGVNMKRPFQLHHTFASEKDQGRKGKHYKNVFSHVWKAQMDIRKGENFLQLKIWSSPTQQYHSSLFCSIRCKEKGLYMQPEGWELPLHHHRCAACTRACGAWLRLEST